MTSQNVRSYLPVPEFNEHIINNHSSKLLHRKDDTLQIIRPPKKPRPRHYDSGFNRSSNSYAQSVSFRDSFSADDPKMLSPIYNKSLNETYFDQCYETISKIGEGSFGEVFKVRSKEDGHLYAVKKSKQFFRSGTYRDERLEEVKRYEQFSGHEHCVTLYKAWEQDDRLYMQMELCEGSLEDYLIHKKTLSESKIWSILYDLLMAVKSLHDRNLIHLDIKLDNILVGDDGLCKLGDFGLVIDVDRANLHQATEGDCRYIAPELLLGNFSKAADIFSLGIAVLELSCNLELPPNGPLWQRLRSGILPEDFIKQISLDLQQIIKKMMTRDPLKRPSVIELLNHPKLFEIHRNRQQWKTIKKIKQNYRNLKKYFWAKICTIKMIMYRLLILILNIFNSKQPDITMIIQNDSSNENNFDPTPLQESPGSNFGDSSQKLYNSTPLNHNFGIFRSRKDLTKTSFTSDGSENYGYESPYIQKHNSVHEISETIVKKLCFKSDDSD